MATKSCNLTAREPGKCEWAHPCSCPCWAGGSACGLLVMLTNREKVQVCLADGEGRKGTQQEESSEFQAPGTPGFLLVSQTQVLSQIKCTRPGKAVFRWTPAEAAK